MTRAVVQSFFWVGLLCVRLATATSDGGLQARDPTEGERLYQVECARCHGFDGRGKESTDNPPVVQQYPSYVIKQMVDFRNGKRWHEYGEQLFEEAEPDELDAMVGYILYLNYAEQP